MTVTADTLRELHRIHMQLSDLKNRLDRGPKQIHIREVSVTEIEVQLTETQNSTRQAKMLSDQKQLDLKTSENKQHFSNGAKKTILILWANKSMETDFPPFAPSPL